MADSHAVDPRVGTTLKGKWRLDRLIGSGGMASVYAASHRNGAVAAIKILHPDFARMAEVRTRFLREGYIANQAGKGAVNVFDDDVDDDGSPYLVMELLRGEVVDSRADRMGGRLPLTEVLWVASETLEALEVAHANAIIHRDLKPENLFWVSPDRIKVLDFGIARLRDATNADERTRAGLVMGTPGFMAPEQALGVADADARTDLWAIGAIMFRLLTGREVHTFTHQNPLVVVATSRAPPITTIEPSVPKAVADIVDRSLQFRREDRFRSAQQMRAHIQALGGGAPVTVPPAAAPAEVRISALPTPTEIVEIEPMSHGFTSGMSEVDTFALSEILTHMADVARLRKEAGPADPGTVVRFEEAYAEATAALATAHIGLFWNVAPEGFAVRRFLIWKSDPRVSTPARMHADGVRMLGLLPEVTREEFDWVVRLVGGDIAPFTSFATFLQAPHLDRIVYRLDAEKPDTPESVRFSLAPPSLSEEDVPSMLTALPASDATTRAALLSRLERRGTGYEGRIGDAIPTADVELAMGLLGVLHAVGTPEARAAMASASASKHAVVRLDAMGRLDDAERFRAELRAMLEADRSQRLEALLGIAKYRIKAAGPALALRIKSPAFDTLGKDERHQALATLEALMPARAEAIGIELLQDQRLVSSEAHETTRRLACQLLGRIGATGDAREALEGAVKSRWRNSEGVRSAASLALASFDARVNARALEAAAPKSRAARPAG